MRKVLQRLGLGVWTALTYLGVVTGIAGVAVLEERAMRADLVASQTSDAQAYLDMLSEDLLSVLRRKFDTGRAIAGAVSLVPDINQDQFSRLGAVVLRGEPSVLNISTIRDLRIAHVHPIEENARILGTDLSTSPVRVASVARVRDTGIGELQGPIELFLGPMGFIVRQPVFVGSEVADPSDARGEFWGMVSLVFSADAVFREVGLFEPDKPYEVAIRLADRDATPIFGDPAVFGATEIQSDISIANAAWDIAVIPMDGWITRPPGLTTRRGTYLLIAIVAVLLTRYFLLLRAERARVSQQLRGAIDVLPGGFVVHDAEDRMVLCNDTYKEFYAKSAPAMVPGNTFEQMLRYGLEHGQFPEAVGREEDWLSERLSAHRSDESFVEQQLVDGRWLRIIERATPDGGRVGVRLDITEIKENALKLERFNAELQSALAARDEAEARFAELSDMSTEWFWEQDADLRFSYLSAGMERATGVDPSAILGRRRDEFARPDAGSTGPAGTTQILEALEAREEFHDLIYRALDVRQDEMWVRTSGRPFYNAEGTFMGYRGTAADVTPLYSALRDAQKADRAKTQFLNVISHELRTPLTVLLGFNRFLTRPHVLPAFKRLANAADVEGREDLSVALDGAMSEVENFARKMDDAGQQLLTLISDMLDLARIESNTVRIQAERVDVAPIVASVVEQFAPMATEKALALVHDVGEVAVYADAARFRQILNNLVNNAIKFTEAGQISIRSERVDDTVVVHVEDTGIGVAEDMQPLIFDRFHQAETGNTRNTSGVGLGLTIIREFVQLMDGEIWVESTLGQGSRFSFSLPAWSDDLGHEDLDDDIAAADRA